MLESGSQPTGAPVARFDAGANSERENRFCSSGPLVHGAGVDFEQKGRKFTKVSRTSKTAARFDEASPERYRQPGVSSLRIHLFVTFVAFCSNRLVRQRSQRRGPQEESGRNHRACSTPPLVASLSLIQAVPTEFPSKTPTGLSVKPREWQFPPQGRAMTDTTRPINEVRPGVLVAQSNSPQAMTYFPVFSSQTMRRQ